MALVIKVDGTAIEVTDSPEIQTLEWQQKQVGGFIEYIPLHPPVTVSGKLYSGMLLNEEGKLMNLRVNIIASSIARQGGLVNDMIAGDVIIFAEGEIE